MVVFDRAAGDSDGTDDLSGGIGDRNSARESFSDSTSELSGIG
jgi:hypothetical protein